MNNQANNNDRLSVNPNEMNPRIESLSMNEIRQEWLDILARIPGDGLKGPGFPRNVLGVIMHNPDTFGPFLEYWVTCKSKMDLTVREQELVILRMACLYASNYVWKHHVPVGIEFGINDSELRAVRDGGTFGSFNEREQVILQLTDELVLRRTIHPPMWNNVSRLLTPKQVVDMIGLVSQYVFFALINNSFQVQVEDAIAAIPGVDE